MLFSCVCFMVIYELILGESSDDVQLRLADCFESHYLVYSAVLKYLLNSTHFFQGNVFVMC
jgi:hypothetical protein